MNLLSINYKRLFFILGFIAAVLVLAWLLYYVFFVPKNRPGNNNNNGNQPNYQNQLPQADNGQGNIVSSTPVTPLPAPGGNNNVSTTNSAGIGGGQNPNLPLQQLSQDMAIGMTPSGNGNTVQYYDGGTQKFYRITNNGTVQTLSDKTFPQVQQVVWAPDKNTAILTYPDGTNELYNFVTAKQITLPKSWSEFSFSPSGAQLAHKTTGTDNDPNNVWVDVANADGSADHRVEQIGINADKAIITWSPNNQIIGLFVDGNGSNGQEVYPMGQNQENFKSFTVTGRGFESVWSPDGSQLLYSANDAATAYRPQLYLVDANGDRIGLDNQALNVATFANKCAFANSGVLYCAVPTSLADGVGLYPQLGVDVPDQLYQVNPKTGARTLITSAGSSYTVSSIQISADGNWAYFTDQATGALHSAKLK